MYLPIIFLYLSIFFLGIITNLIVLKSKKIHPYLAKFIYISSYKSDSSALLLGGLSLFIPMMICLNLELFGVINHLSFNPVLWIFPACLLGFAGYYDDRFELRARYKLLLQVSAVASLVIIRFYFLENRGLGSYIESAIMMFLGVVCLNGTNLLDGLDTLSIKYTFVTNFLFGALGIALNIPDLVSFSIISFLPLAGFYFFNKAPAKLYLGEIGGTLIGFNTLFMSILIYDYAPVSTAFGFDFIDIVALSFMGMYLPAMEIGVSFIRRLANKKSPFFGDKLHLHYLIVDLLGLKAQRAASIAALSHFAIVVIALSFIHLGLSGKVVFFAISMMSLSLYYAVGFRSWHFEKNFESDIENNLICLKSKTIINYLAKDKVISDAEIAEDLLLSRLKYNNIDTDEDSEEAA